MKGIKLGFLIVSLTSLFLIVLFNSFSIAQDSSDVAFIDSSIYPEFEKSDKVSVIVKLVDNVGSNDINKIKKASVINIKGLADEMSVFKQGFEIVYEYPAFNSLSAMVSRDSLEALGNSDLVESVNLDDVLYTQLQQSLPLINATQAWNVVVGMPYSNLTGNLTGAGLPVCVIDTGVDYTHPALGGVYGTKVYSGYDFVNNDYDPRDDNGHGTHVAGIIAANGMINSTTWIKGVAPDARIIAVKSCNAAGTCPTSSVLAGLNHCLTVINPGKLAAISMSLGNLMNHNSSNCPTTYNAAINTAFANGVPVVVASGNQGFKNGISYPACSPNATSVGMTYDASSTLNMGWNVWNGTCTDSSIVADKVSCASNSGSNLDLMAPGARIDSTASSVGLACHVLISNPLVSRCSGTSMATAHVSGAIVLMKQKYFTRLGNVNSYTSIKLESLLKGSGIPVVDLGNGLTFPRLSLNRVL